MNIEGWRYYNHAAIPTTEPQEEVNFHPIKDKTIWKIGGGTALLARWTSDWDCGEETNWYYVIKDDPFDINSLKAKRRYEIKKGNRYFFVRKIDPDNYVDELLDVQIKAFSSYPESYRPTDLNRENLEKSIKQWKKDSWDVFGTFSKANESLCGYSVLNPRKTEIEFQIEKTDPTTERDGINAATVNGILEYYASDIKNGKYICDGEKPIYHETHFQDYLIKYFGFRKAYCRLNIAYKPGMNLVVKILYPFRKLLRKYDNKSSVHKVNGVLRMEEIVRSEKE